MEGRVVASAVAEVEVRKLGFERLVAEQAVRSSLMYGLFAVGLSVLMGWLAGRVFALT
ncbi:putative transmembrane protein [compost metagenome]